MQSITDSEQKLLKLLLKDSRASIESIGDRIKKSRNWVARTIKRLVERGVIRSYVTILDPAQVYAERNTILLVKTNPRELGVSQALLDMPELESLDGVSGEHSLLGLFRFRRSQAFNTFLDTIDKVIAGSGAQTYNLVQVLTTYKTHGFVIDRTSNSEQILSSKDWELLRVLTRYPATDKKPLPPTQSDIGKMVRLSQPAVSKAMQRLEERQAIIGYSVDTDFRFVGLPIKFFLQVRPEPGRIAETAEAISVMDEVWDLHRISEDYSLSATVRTDSVASYNIFMRELYKNKNVVDTESQISLEEWFVPVYT